MNDKDKRDSNGKKKITDRKLKQRKNTVAPPGTRRRNGDDPDAAPGKKKGS